MRTRILIEIGASTIEVTSDHHLTIKQTEFLLEKVSAVVNYLGVVNDFHENRSRKEGPPEK